MANAGTVCLMKLNEVLFGTVPYDGLAVLTSDVGWAILQNLPVLKILKGRGWRQTIKAAGEGSLCIERGWFV